MPFWWGRLLGYLDRRALPDLERARALRPREGRGLLVPWVVGDGVTAPGERPFSFGMFVPERQRAAVAHWVCGLCGSPLPQRAVLVMPIERYEPPVHEECLLYALPRCPALRRGVEAFWVRRGDIRAVAAEGHVRLQLRRGFLPSRVELSLS